MGERLHMVISGGLLAGLLGVFVVVGLMGEADSNPPTRSPARAHPDQPVELGDVRWRRDWEAALVESREADKPLLVLFDEVPGCSTVIGYGKRVLRDPLLVEAAETLFVPVVVYNNVGGADREVLESFGEPTWNNPVVRIIDADRKALAPRLAGDYTRAGLATAMERALKASGESVPGWLSLVAAEARAERDGAQTATFGMYCFWSGEASFGGVDGVVSTRTGFLHGREVVEVTYEEGELSYGELASFAKESGAGEVAFAHDGAQMKAASATFGSAASRKEDELRHSKKDDKYRLRHSKWAYVPMTPAQATRANALLSRRSSPAPVLSPRQRGFYTQIVAHPDAGWPLQLGRGELQAAFGRAEAVAGKVKGDTKAKKEGGGG